MDCSLAALIACFSWSNLYIDSGLSVQDYSFEHQTERASYLFLDGAYQPMTYEVRSSHAGNPYGRVALGYELNFRKVSWSMEASHVSSLNTDSDRGINAISINARWYPFR